MKKKKQDIFLQDIMSNQILILDGLSIKNQYIYCINGRENALYKISIETGEIEKVIQLQGEKERAYYGTVIIENEIILKPGISNLFAKINLDNKEVTYFEYSNKKEKWNEYLPFIQYDNKIFNFPFAGKQIEIINLENFESNFISLNLPKKESTNCFTKRLVKLEDKVILPCSFKNILLEFNLKTNKLKWIDIIAKNNDKGFRDILLLNNKIFLLSQENELLKIDINFKNEVQLITKFDDEYEFILYHKECMILLPKFNNKIVKFNINNNKIEYIQEINLSETEIDDFVKYINYSDVIENEKYIITISRYNKAIVVFDKNTKHINCKKLKYSMDEIKKRREKSILNLHKGNIEKEEIFSISDFLQII